MVKNFKNKIYKNIFDKICIRLVQGDFKILLKVIKEYLIIWKTWYVDELKGLI